MERSPALAAALAVVPALGHAYLRRWLRALAWLSFIVGGTLGYVELFDVSFGTGAEPPVWTLTLFGVLIVLSVLDAYALARRDVARTGLSCSGCGYPMSPSLGFCWYCARRFDGLYE